MSPHRRTSGDRVARVNRRDDFPSMARRLAAPAGYGQEQCRTPAKINCFYSFSSLFLRLARAFDSVSIAFATNAGRAERDGASAGTRNSFTASLSGGGRGAAEKR